MRKSKYDANWWLGENSWYAKSGFKEKLTGVVSSEPWAVPVEHKLNDQTTVLLFGVIGLILLKQFKIL